MTLVALAIAIFNAFENVLLHSLAFYLNYPKMEIKLTYFTSLWCDFA